LTSILMQSINKNVMKWLTAEQALKFLGVRSQTLYANVSRGRIRAKPDPADSRRSLYNGKDVARLAERRPGQRPAETVATQAIGWGDPVLASGISTVANGRLWYRGRDAVRLAETATLEDIAGLLWQGAVMRLHAGRAATKSERTGTPIARLLSAVSERAAVDPPSLGRSPAVLKSEAELLFGGLLAASLGTVTARLDLPVHTHLAKAWRKPQAQDILRRTLVLLADHELNASTFAVRVAASTGDVAVGLPAGWSCDPDRASARRRGARAFVLARRRSPSWRQ
jgi:citrate synthase